MRSRVVIGWDLEGERGWKSKQDLMNGKFACWPALRGRAGFEIVPRMENENGRTRIVRRRFSAEEKARIVGLYEQSGLTRGEFCRREGVSLFNLQRCWESRTDPEKRAL